MRAVIQRVSEAQVTVEGLLEGKIGRGVVVLLGIGPEDSSDDIAWLVRKIAQLKIFASPDGPSQLSLLDIEGEALVISQFTLFASTKKGTKPSYSRAAPPAQAEALYEEFLQALDDAIDPPIASGQFAAMMQVSLTNDGPVTLLLDSKNRE